MGQMPQKMVGEQFNNLVSYIKNYGDGTLAQNTEKFMLDLGIAKRKSIRFIMVEEG